MTTQSDGLRCQLLLRRNRGGKEMWIGRGNRRQRRHRRRRQTKRHKQQQQQQQQQQHMDQKQDVSEDDESDDCDPDALQRWLASNAIPLPSGAAPMEESGSD
eukprot:TRINITY_DN66300_c5_g4_i5.p4 TRINITY_DN66300_c5_g4~~TRINITY_DN66300_c5_g4_i5.p4  ORF type:complete len:102 (-),score=34.65 TRINITY_DN66300_c5_g4_i5:58-363(-)